MRQIQPGYRELVVMICLATGLAACGGDSSNIPPDDPDFSDSALRLAVGGRELVFEWDGVPRATHYKLFENPDGSSGFTQVGENISPFASPAALDVELDDGVYTATLDVAVHRFDWVNARYRLESCDAADSCTLVGEQSPFGLSAGAIQYIRTTTAFDGAFGFSLALSNDGTAMVAGAIGEPSTIFLEDGNPADLCDENDVPVVTGEDEEGNAIFVFEDGTLVPEEAEVDGCTTSPGSGTVIVFDLAADEFTLEAFVKASNFDDLDAFGTSVAISDDASVLAVSASGESSADLDDLDNNDAQGAGAVYVYKRDIDNNWPTPGTGGVYVKAPNIDAEDFFGSQIALSGNGQVLAVAAAGESSNATGVTMLPLGEETIPDALSNNAADDAGAVYIFRSFFGNWVPEAYIKASNAEAGDLFGSAIDLNFAGDLLVVGAIGESAADATSPNDNSKPGSGAAYVYGWADSEWSQLDYLKASNADAAQHSGDSVGDAYGAAVAFNSDGSLLLIGAPNEDSIATGIDGDAANNGFRNSGAAYLLTRNGDTWQETTYFKASNTGEIDEFGSAVDINDITGDDDISSAIVIGARRESSSATGVNGTENIDNFVASGAAYYFENGLDGWQQQTFIKAAVANFGMLFGWDVAMSAEGSIIAVSAPFEDSLNSDAGAVFLY